MNEVQRVQNTGEKGRVVDASRDRVSKVGVILDEKAIFDKAIEDICRKIEEFEKSRDYLRYLAEKEKYFRQMDYDRGYITSGYPVALDGYWMYSDDEGKTGRTHYVYAPVEPEYLVDLKDKLAKARKNAEAAAARDALRREVAAKNAAEIASLQGEVRRLQGEVRRLQEEVRRLQGEVRGLEEAKEDSAYTIKGLEGKNERLEVRFRAYVQPRRLWMELAKNEPMPEQDMLLNRIVQKLGITDTRQQWVTEAALRHIFYRESLKKSVIEMEILGVSGLAEAEVQAILPELRSKLYAIDPELSKENERME